MNGLTALEGLLALGLPPGATLAITGGAGLLASYAIPLAKQAGLRVIADAAPQDADLVASFGTDVVVPRGDGFNQAVRQAAPAGPTDSWTMQRSPRRWCPRSATAASSPSSAAGTAPDPSAGSR